MQDSESVVVDIKKIMEEIKSEVEKNGPYDEILSFSEIPIQQIEDEQLILNLRAQVNKINSDLMIPPVFAQEGNILKRLYKKIICKLVRCATFPMSVRMSETNAKLREAIDTEAQVIEQQQRLINSLMGRIEKLEEQYGS